MADVVEEYVKEDPSTAPRKVVFERCKRKDDPELATEERMSLSRKRDILASVALIDGLEKYAERTVSASDVRKMKEKDLERLFDVYEAKSGQELLGESLSLVAEGVVRSLSLFLSFDDREALKEDLMSNRQLRHLVGRYAAKVSEEYGDFVAIIRLGFDVARHATGTPVVSLPKDHAPDHKRNEHGRTSNPVAGSDGRRGRVEGRDEGSEGGD